MEVAGMNESFFYFQQLHPVLGIMLVPGCTLGAFNLIGETRATIYLLALFGTAVQPQQMLQ